MVGSAPRISPLLLRAMVELDEPGIPIAELARRVGGRADELGLPRPSYERVRELVQNARQLERRGPSTLSVLWDVSMQLRPVDHLLDQLDGDGAPDYRDWKRRRYRK